MSRRLRSTLVLLMRLPTYLDGKEIGGSDYPRASAGYVDLC